MDLSQVSTNKEASGEPPMDPQQRKEMIKQEKKAKRKLAMEKQKNPGIKNFFTIKKVLFFRFGKQNFRFRLVRNRRKS